LRLDNLQLWDAIGSIEGAETRMPAKVTPAVAYIRTDSAANFNLDKEGDKRQFDAISAYAAGRYDIAGTFYNPIVIGLDPIDVRRGFIRLLYYCREHGIGVVLVENAERFARDLYVQLTGHELLRRRGHRIGAGRRAVTFHRTGADSYVDTTDPGRGSSV
jgi:hypothetical protein